MNRQATRNILLPIEPAIAWMKRSLLADGQIARFYELQTNRPLYFVRDTYELTYDDSNLPTHYGFKAKSRLDKIEKRYQELKQTGKFKKSVSNLKTLTRDATRIVSELDDEGRWLSNDKGEPVTASTHLKGQASVISSVNSSAAIWNASANTCRQCGRRNSRIEKAGSSKAGEPA
jgi:hypothetical protein